MLIPKASHHTLLGGRAIAAAIATRAASARKPAPAKRGTPMPLEWPGAALASLQPGSFRLLTKVAAIE